MFFVCHQLKNTVVCHLLGFRDGMILSNENVYRGLGVDRKSCFDVGILIKPLAEKKQFFSDKVRNWRNYNWIETELVVVFN